MQNTTNQKTKQAIINRVKGLNVHIMGLRHKMKILDMWLTYTIFVNF